MNDIVKICKIHGELNTEKVQKDGIYYRCRQCRVLKTRESWHRNKHKYAEKFREERRETVNESLKVKRLANLDEYRKYGRDKYQRDKDRQNILRAIVKFQFNIDDFYKMLEAQNNRCAICGNLETRRFNGNITRLALDHCHKTGRVRGLLCHACNTGIGKFNDDIELMGKAMKYIRKHNEIS